MLINENSEDLQHVINELSGMMLSSNRKINISDRQRDLVKILFGDVATQAYKDKIKVMEESLSKSRREVMEFKEELKGVMGNYLDDLQRFEKQRVVLEKVREGVLNGRRDLGSEWVKELSSGGGQDDYGYFFERKNEILNRMSELNYEISTKFDTEPSNIVKKPEQNDMDTFMLELDHLEKYSTKQITDNKLPKSGRLNLTFRDCFSKVSNF